MRTGLIIGRFQPFHLGHLHLIKVALEQVDKLVIAIGSSNVCNQDNPLSYQQRKQLLEQVVAKEGWQTKVKLIFPLPDYPDDNDRWLQNLLQQAGNFDIHFGNNNYSNDVLKAAGYEIYPVDLKQRKQLEGTSIRQQIRAGQKAWDALVPSYLVDSIQSALSRE